MSSLRQLLPAKWPSRRDGNFPLLAFPGLVVKDSYRHLLQRDLASNTSFARPSDACYAIGQIVSYHCLVVCPIRDVRQAVEASLLN